MLGILIYAQNTSIPLLEIDQDTIILVRSVLTLPNTTFLYGEKVDNVQYGGKTDSLFIEHQVKQNMTINGVTVDRNNDKEIELIIIKEELQDTATVSLICAIEGNKKNDWYPDSTKKITIRIVPKLIEEEQSQDSIKSNISTAQADVESPSGKGDDVYEFNTSKEDFYTIKKQLICFEWLSGINLICIIVLFVLLYKSIKNSKNSFIEARTEIFDEINKQIAKSQNSPQKKEEERFQSHYDGLNKSDIESLIDSKINNLIQSHSHLVKYTPKPEKQKIDILDKPEKSGKYFETEDVILDYENAVFRLGQTDIKIFRIYTRGLEYYYTITDNNNIRTEFVDMIPSFTNFVTVVDANVSKAKKVEPVKDGRLIKKGDEFWVDHANKLELRFV